MTTTIEAAAPALGCNYWMRGTTYECRGDGYLWDADDDGYDPDDTSSPCPRCNTKAYLETVKEEAEAVISGSCNGVHYTGRSLWERAVETARSANAQGADAALRAIENVQALEPDGLIGGGERVHAFTYA